MRPTNRARRLWHAVNGISDGFVIAGLVGIAAHNARLWRRDQRLVERYRAELAGRNEVLESTPRVSIIVAAWNEADFIDRHIRSVQALSYPNLEYVLCAGGSDGTLEIARRYQGPGRIVLEQLPGEGKQGALRKAFAHATGEIVYLTDADCLLDDDSFTRVLAPIVNGNEVASSGMSRPLDEQMSSMLSRYQHYRDVYWLMHRGSVGQDIFGRNAAIRAEVLARLGAFRQSVATGTDYHLSGLLRAHDIRVINSESLVRTRVPDSLPEYVRMWQRWIRNLLVQGPRSQRLDEAARAAIAGVLGGVALSGPAFWLVGGAVARLWVLLIWWGWTQRLRQTSVAASAVARSESWLYVISLLLFQLADGTAAASAPIQVARRAWRARW